MAIVTVTLNPALDATSETEELVPNRKLRCSKPRLDPGGGGVNVSRALLRLGARSRAFVAIGGPTGEHLVELLAAEGIEAVRFPAPGVTRQSFTVNEAKSNDQYRFVHPGPEWSRSEAQLLEGRILQATGEGDFVVLSGSLPPGLPADTYATLADALEGEGRSVTVDTSGDSLRAFRHAAHGTHCIRMNRREAEELAGRELPDMDATAAFGRELVEAAFSRVVVLTHGGEGAVFVSADEVHRVPGRPVERVSAVGAGDSFVAALTLGLSRGWSLRSTGCYAMAAAASALTTPATELCRSEQVEQFFEELKATGDCGP